MKRISKSNRRGQGLTEYIIIVALIAIASIGVITRFSDNIKALIGMAIDALASRDNVTARTKISNAALEKGKTLKTFANNNAPD